MHTKSFEMTLPFFFFSFGAETNFWEQVAIVKMFTDLVMEPDVRTLLECYCEKLCYIEKVKDVDCLHWAIVCPFVSVDRPLQGLWGCEVSPSRIALGFHRESPNFVTNVGSMSILP